eukprot:3791252-Pyramimonas_sp.AAC.1
MGAGTALHNGRPPESASVDRLGSGIGPRPLQSRGGSGSRQGLPDGIGAIGLEKIELRTEPHRRCIGDAARSSDPHLL